MKNEKGRLSRFLNWLTSPAGKGYAPEAGAEESSNPRPPKGGTGEVKSKARSKNSFADRNKEFGEPVDPVMQNTKGADITNTDKSKLVEKSVEKPYNKTGKANHGPIPKTSLPKEKSKRENKKAAPKKKR